MIRQQLAGRRDEPERGTALASDRSGHSDTARLDVIVDGQHAIAAALAQGDADAASLLGAYARMLENAYPGTQCAALVLDPETRKVQAQSGAIVSEDRWSLTGLVESSDGPAAFAAGENRLIWISELAKDPRWPDHGLRALAKGYRSCWFYPVAIEGEGSIVLLAAYGLTALPCLPDLRLLKMVAGFMTASICAVQQREAAKKATERFDSLTAALPGVVYQRVVSLDGDIRYTYISEGARDLFGVAPETIISDPQALFSRHDKGYSAKFRERLLAASKSLSMWDVEATIVTPDGRKKYTHAIARPERKNDGSVVWTGVILDETRTREALLESLSQGVVLYDSEDRLVLRNSHFLRLYPELNDIAVPGATYDDVARAEITARAALSGGEKVEALLAKRLAQHREPHCMFEQELEGGRWVLVNQHRTLERGTVVLYTDVTELKTREKQIQHLAHHDTLTGLANRALFGTKTQEALESARRLGSTVAVLCLDLDHFKTVNDTLGHGAGDVVLKTIGSRLQDALRPSDFVARLGGDEFGIIISDLKHPGYLPTLAYRLLRAAAEPVDYNGQQLTTGLSIGVASSATDGSEPETLLKNADLALYRAKADGRGTFRFFEAEMDAKAQMRRSREIALREAVARNELELHYQPQVDTESGDVVGFEALVRWRHPTLGLVPPSEFIPLAEETGIIHSLGEWVLREACREAQKWPSNVKIAVNVSPAQFRKRNLTEVVAGILEETGLRPARLDIEVTESLLLRDVESSLATLRSLKELGVQISMDDFGTGYSSLSNLRSFPFDKIKIDKSFVSEVEHSEDSTAIVRAVLGLGRSLGMATCAEGVETETQLDCLRREGCTLVQGYFYSRPRPASELASLLENQLGRS